ncbi:MAG: caspase family protein [Bacteriovoracaceae bacterium]
MGTRIHFSKYIAKVAAHIVVILLVLLPAYSQQRKYLSDTQNGGTIIAMQFNKSGDRLYTLNSDGRIRCWDVSTGLLMSITEDGKSAGETPWEMTVNNDTETALVSTLRNPTVRLWDLRSGKVKKEYNVFNNFTHALRWINGGKTIAGLGNTNSGNNNSDVDQFISWDAETGSIVKQFFHLGGGIGIRSLDFTKDEKYVLLCGESGQNENYAYIVDYESGDDEKSIEAHRSWVLSAVYSPDNTLIATASLDHNVKIFDARTGENVASFYEHSKAARKVLFTPEGKYLVSSGEDGKVIVYDVVSKSSVWSENYGASDEGVPFAISPDGKYLAAGSSSVIISTLEKKSIVGTIHDYSVRPKKYFFDDNGSLTKDSTAALCLSTIEITGTAPEGAQPTFNNMKNFWMLSTPVGQYEASGAADSLFTFFDAPENFLPAITDSIPNVAAEVYDISRLETFAGSLRKINHDLLTQRYETVKKKNVFERTTDTPFLVIDHKKHTARVSKVLFTPDGKEIITSSWDKSIRVWNASNGELQRVIRIPAYPGAEGQIYTMALSPDAKYIAVAGYSVGAGDIERYGGDYVLLIDFASGDIVDLIALHGQAIFSLAFSSDGTMLASGGGSTDNIVWIYTIHPDAMHILKREGGVKMNEMITGLSGIPNSRDFMTSDLSGIGGRIYPQEYDAEGNITKKAVATALVLSPGKEFGMGSPAYHSLAVHPTGKIAAFGSGLGTQLIFTDSSNHARSRISPFMLKSVYCTAFSPNGKNIAVAQGNEIRIFTYPMPGDTIDAVNVLSFTKHDNSVLSLAYSPDGKLIASSGGNSNQVYVWNAATGAVNYELGGDSKPARIWALGSHTSHPSVIGFGNESAETTSVNNLGRITTAFDLSTLSFVENPDENDFITSRNVNEKNNVSAPYFEKNFVSGEMQSYVQLKDGTIIIGSEYGVYAKKDGELAYVSYSGLSARCVGVSSDNIFFFAGLADGRIEIYRQSNRELAATLFIDADREWILWSPEGYYTASRHGAKMAGWQINPWRVNTQEFKILSTAQRGDVLRIMMAKNPKFYPFEQFDIRLNRPDIVLSKLGVIKKEKYFALKQAYARRLKKLGIQESSLSALLSVPKIKVSALPAQTKEKLVTFTVEADADSFFVKTISLLLNDVPVYGAKGLPVGGDSSRAVKKVFSLEVPNGRNKIQISVRNSAGIESSLETYYVTYSSAKPVQQNRFIVAIGVSDYKDNDYDLKYAAKDASDLSVVLSQNSATGKTKVLKILDKDATRENILKAKEFLRQAKVNDLVILFAAGHGLLDKNLDWYFATHDIDFDHPSLRGISYDELEGLLDGIPAVKKMMLMDACHSGEVDKDESVLIAVTSADQANIKSRGFKKKVEKKSFMGLSNSFELMQQLFSDLNRGTGATVISSASGAEYAYESAEWNNGIFTYSLLDGIKSKGADKNNDKQIRISELRDYVITTVQKATGGKQHPTSRKENIEYDFRVW